MLPDKKLWRFANLNPDPDGWDDIIGNICESLKSSQPIPPDIVDWKQWTRSNPSSHDIADFMYAYGFSVDLICAVLHASVQISLNSLRARKSIDARDGISKASYFYIPIGIALLIDSSELLRACQDEVKDFHESAFSGIDATLRKYYEFTNRLLDIGDLATMKTLTYELSQKRHIPYHKYFLVFDKGSSDFSDLLIQDAIEYRKSPVQRSRMRKARAGDMVSIGSLPVISYALHRGLCFSGYDPSLPIWDFPIAQRPEIQALLSKEIVERIPRPAPKEETHP